LGDRAPTGKETAILAKQEKHLPLRNRGLELLVSLLFVVNVALALGPHIR